jgi:hypothetical protein
MRTILIALMTRLTSLFLLGLAFYLTERAVRRHFQ